MGELALWWTNFLKSRPSNMNWWGRKKSLCEKRDAKIVRIQGDGQHTGKLQYQTATQWHYLIHLKFFIKQQDTFYLEEQVLPFQYKRENGAIVDHMPVMKTDNREPVLNVTKMERAQRQNRLDYDRFAVVRYAEHWWDSYNPAYRKFDVDCTNYVSQCMRAGGAPMRGMMDRGNGWWYQDKSWSYSWAVAHSLRWYLSGSTSGLQGMEKEKASDLVPGDVICYDFQGDGHWDHNTIVVGKDKQNMPLVNAHTYNARNRYWSYEDSPAWTPNIQYKFFHIHI